MRSIGESISQAFKTLAEASAAIQQERALSNERHERLVAQMRLNWQNAEDALNGLEDSAALDQGAELKLGAAIMDFGFAVDAMDKYRQALVSIVAKYESSGHSDDYLLANALLGAAKKALGWT